MHSQKITSSKAKVMLRSRTSLVALCEAASVKASHAMTIRSTMVLRFLGVKSRVSSQGENPWFKPVSLN